jgi:sugar-specific transcriptional regulator TrmB
LQALGQRTYAARTFVALVRLGEGTAQDVSNVADVPRTRVYDAVAELEREGLVDVQQSTPKRFWAISRDTTGRHFERDYTERVERLTAALDALETDSGTEEQRGVWTVTGRDTVTERVTDFVRDAEEEVVFMTVEPLLSDEILDALRTASDRGVTIYLADMADTVEADVQERIPDAEVFESLWVWSDSPAGRLLMVDGEQTLVSVLVDGDGDHPPEPLDETAIWGSGETNGLVVVLRAIFTWQLDVNRG